MQERLRFNSWVKKIPWSRKWQPTLVFLPGKSHGRRSVVGYSSLMGGSKRVGHDIDMQPKKKQEKFRDYDCGDFYILL